MHPVEQLAENYLVICIEPTEGIALRFNTKIPGPVIRIDGVQTKFFCKDHFKAEPATGYETLIYDCMIGDNILFQRVDGVVAGWRAVQPFLDAWRRGGTKGLEFYPAGSEGPPGAFELLRAEAGGSSDRDGLAETAERLWARIQWRWGTHVQEFTFGFEALASGAMIATGQRMRQSRLVWLFLADGHVGFREEAETPRAESPLPFSATVR